MLERYRRAIPFGAFACAAITIVSYFGPGGGTPDVFICGFAAAVMMLVSHPLSRLRPFARRPNRLLFWASLGVAGTVGMLASHTGGFQSPGVAALLLIWLFGSIISPLTPLECVADALSQTVLIGAIIWLTVPKPGNPGIFFAVSACGICFLAAGMTLRDQANERAFHVQRRLDTVNEELERRVDEQVAEIRRRAERIEVLNRQLQQRVIERSRELEVALTRLARPARLSSPPIGALLNGRFELVRRIDSGGMADVFEGLDRVTQTSVAVKTIHGRNFSDVSSLHRFLREARAAAAVIHPGIARTLDVDIMENGTLFQVMELLEGETLASWLGETRSRPIGVIARVGTIVAEALAAAHAAGVVHRDIKPANVMLLGARSPWSSSGEHPVGAARDLGVKVLDFGVSKLDGPAADVEEGLRVTRPHAVIGTPAYMAPEQALDPSSAGPAADIYSLGVLLYEALSDLLPYEGASAPHVGSPVHISEVRPELPPAIADVVMRCLACNPGERPTGESVADELRPFQELETELESGARTADAFLSTVAGTGRTRAS
jgi:tRNA A-37 threonylcarbamoyl transferase component Bud32